MQVLQLALGVGGQVGVARVAEAAYGVVSGAPVIVGLLVVRETRSGRLIDRDHHAVRDVAKAGQQLQHPDASDQYRHHQAHLETIVIEGRSPGLVYIYIYVCVIYIYIYYMTNSSGLDTSQIGLAEVVIPLLDRDVESIYFGRRNPGSIHRRVAVGDA